MAGAKGNAGALTIGGLISALKNPTNINRPTHNMNDFACLLLPIAAVGYSMLYLLFGGGLGGAVVIFIIAKFLGK